MDGVIGRQDISRLEVLALVARGEDTGCVAVGKETIVVEEASVAIVFGGRWGEGGVVVGAIGAIEVSRDAGRESECSHGWEQEQESLVAGAE